MMKVGAKAVAAAAVLLSAAFAQAGTVTCPNATGATIPGEGNSPDPTTNRQLVVTGALAGGTCYYQEGNLTDSPVSYLGAGSELIEKDVVNSGATTGLLRWEFTGSGAPLSQKGKFSFDLSQWSVFEELFIGFHFGGGSGAPDSFVVELEPVVTSGTWELIPANLANGLSNIYLFGRDRCDAPNECVRDPQGDVPEPGTLALVAAALLGLARFRGNRG
jgi:PEP-CTERM motif